MGHVRMSTPAGVSTCPTVGANCRGGVMADAMGRLKLGAGWTPEDPGREDALESAHRRTQRSTQVQGPREEVKPLLLLV